MEGKTKACPFCWEEILTVAKKCKHCGEMLESKKLWKKIFLWAMYLLAIFWVLTIIVLIIPSGENTRNAYKADFIKPMDQIIKDLWVKEWTEEFECLKWLWREIWNINDITSVNHEERDDYRYIVWNVIQNNKDREFICAIKKKNNKMISLMLDWNILSVNTEKDSKDTEDIWWGNPADWLK